MRSAVIRFCWRTVIPVSGWILVRASIWAHEYFINWLQPRRGNGLRDYFEFGLLAQDKWVIRGGCCWVLLISVGRSPAFREFF